MKLGYCTNGLALHDLMGGLELLATTGYRSVAVCINHGWLGLHDPDFGVRLQQTKSFLDQQKLGSVVEATAPFVLDPFTPHGPSLVDGNPALVARRLEYLRHCVDIAAELGSDCVSFKSGYKPAGLSYMSAIDQFVQNLKTILAYATEKQVQLSIEPTPGMLIDHSGRYDRLLHLLQDHALKLTLDIGQMFCLSEVPIGNFIEKWQEQLINVHICDVRVGNPVHLPFGEGQVYLPPILEALVNIGYVGGVHVELDRHSDRAVEATRTAYATLGPLFLDISQSGSLV